MTLKEITYLYQNSKTDGIQSDDTKSSDAEVGDSIHYFRAKLIRQEIDRGMKLDPVLIQSLLDVEVERVKFNRGQPLSGKTVYRTVKPLPRAIATKGSNLVLFVGDNLLGRSFQRSTATKVQFDSFRPYTGLNPKWFEFNNHIYIATEDSLTDIVVQLVAENPTKVLEFTGAVDLYDPTDYEYPISITMMDSLFKLLNDMDNAFGSTGTDDLNDGQDDVTRSNNSSKNNNNN